MPERSLAAPHHRPDLRLPMPLRNLRLISIGSVALGLALSAIGLIVLLALGGPRSGALSTAAVAPFLTASGVGVRIVARRRRQLMARLKAMGWRACTVCAHPLEDGVARCTGCGVEITADQAIAAWGRTA